MRLIDADKAIEIWKEKNFIKFVGQEEKAKMLLDVLPTEPMWIPVSEKLPKDFDIYLITLESGDVCKCEFNPDYIDEEHDKGAFTYYHEYFDNYTFGLIDSEEIAVDAIAWMPFEPYMAESDKESDNNDT